MPGRRFCFQHCRIRSSLWNKSNIKTYCIHSAFVCFNIFGFNKEP
uniref:Uncharacterized protein n=1 Tax=Arundo donax TaxID=35708 RepID=A0A0A8XS64_ARUDO